MLIGMKIFNLRINKGMSKAQLSRTTGISCKTIMNYECDKYQPKFENAKKIADVLGVTTDYLYSIKRY